MNYSMVGLQERVDAAKTVHRAFIEEKEEKYRQRKAWRAAHGIPVFAILGMGRSGKDTAAEYLCAATGLKYGGSSSNNLVKFVAHAAEGEESVVWAERHQNREFWITVGHMVRGKDLSLLARMILGDGDFAVGLRGRQELHGAVRDGVLDASVWIANPRAAVDPTVEFTAEDCDLMISNHGSYLEFYSKLDKLIALTGLLVSPERKTDG